MEIRNQTEDKAELCFYGDIASESWQSEWYEEDKCPKDILDFLNGLEGIKEIDVRINSGGGSVFGGIAIYNLLKSYGAKITTHIEALAASIASVIACAGDRIIMYSNAAFMIHKPLTSYFYTSKNADDLRKDADLLDGCQKSILTSYMTKTKEGVTEETINQLINDETWLWGDEVLQYFDFEIAESIDAAACTSQYFNKYKNTQSNFKGSSFDDGTTNEVNIEEIAIKVLEKIENKKEQEIRNSILKDLDQFGI